MPLGVHLPWLQVVGRGAHAFYEDDAAHVVRGAGHITRDDRRGPGELGDLWRRRLVVLKRFFDLFALGSVGKGAAAAAAKARALKAAAAAAAAAENHRDADTLGMSLVTGAAEGSRRGGGAEAGLDENLTTPSQRFLSDNDDEKGNAMKMKANMTMDVTWT